MRRLRVSVPPHARHSPSVPVSPKNGPRHLDLLDVIRQDCPEIEAGLVCTRREFDCFQPKRTQKFKRSVQFGWVATGVGKCISNDFHTIRGRLIVGAKSQTMPITQTWLKSCVSWRVAVDKSPRQSTPLIDQRSENRSCSNPPHFDNRDQFNC